MQSHAMTLEEQDFAFLARLIKARSGIIITPEKYYLLESRLLPVMRKLELPNLAQLAQSLRTHEDSRTIQEIVDRMTTNETSFFRDIKPFTAFKEHILPELTKRNSYLRIWCAACSTGQEPYTLAMIIKQAEKTLPNLTADILATDLSEEALHKARQASYTQFEVQRGLPISLLMEYFEQQADKWILKPEVQNMVEFRQHNLLESVSTLSTHDIIFCRNVLIYFDETTKRKVLGMLAGALRDGGFLVIGSSETLHGLSEQFTSYNKAFPGIYQKQQ